MIYCTNCGHPNPDGSNFCSQCGTALEKRAAQRPSDPAAARSAQDSGEPQAAQSPGTPTDTDADTDADAGRSGAPGKQAPATGDTTRTMQPMAEDEDAGLSSDDVEAVNALPRGSALLIVRRGADAGRFLLDTESTTVGRIQDADILLDDISVSRRHAVFTRTDAGVVVKDVGSLNGTYVNRQMVDEQLLRAGDEVQIGKFRLVFYAARG